MIGTARTTGARPRPNTRRALLAATLALACLGSRPCQAAHWHLPFHLRRWLRRERWLELKEHTHRPKATATDKRDGFIVFARDPLERIYATSRPRPQDLVGDLQLTAAQDQYEPAQMGGYAVRDLDAVTVGVSDLTSDTGDVLAAVNIPSGGRRAGRPGHFSVAVRRDWKAPPCRSRSARRRRACASYSPGSSASCA